MPLKGGKTVNLEGTVIYVKVFSEDISTISPGMGIEFKELTSNDSEMLRTYITELLTKDIIKEQDEPIIKKDYGKIKNRHG